LTAGAENFAIALHATAGVIVPQSDRESGLKLKLGLSSPQTSRERRVEFYVDSFFISKFSITVKLIAVLWDRNNLRAGALARTISRDRPLPNRNPFLQQYTTTLQRMTSSITSASAKANYLVFCETLLMTLTMSRKLPERKIQRTISSVIPGSKVKTKEDRVSERTTTVAVVNDLGFVSQSITTLFLPK
jgi:hypothetical protein